MVRSVNKNPMNERFVPEPDPCRFSRFLRLSVRSFAVESGVGSEWIGSLKKSLHNEDS